ncbi:MAG: ATP synthase subunit I [Acidobacteriales bacterium]|nr:ATP synthase subunit I [Terriglobales bacterium]
MSVTLEEIQTGAPRRILISVATFGAIGTVAADILSGNAMAGGVAMGAVATWLSFFWLRFTMKRLTEIAAGDPETRFSVLGLVLRFLLRYAVVGLSAYVMMKSSHVSAVGIVIGLLLIVPALFLESVYLLVQSRRFGA